MLVVSVDAKKIQDALRKSPEIVKKHISEAIEKSMFTLEGKAKEITPVDTGRLRGSIGVVERGELWGIVGTPVEYAKFQEFGTRFIKPRAFMKGGTEASMIDIRGFFREATINIAKDLEK